MNTSDGLRALLLRHDLIPTGDSKIDIELARQVMPRSYNNDKTRNRATQQLFTQKSKSEKASGAVERRVEAEKDD